MIPRKLPASRGHSHLSVEAGDISKHAALKKGSEKRKSKCIAFCHTIELINVADDDIKVLHQRNSPSNKNLKFPYKNSIKTQSKDCQTSASTRIHCQSKK